MQLFTVYLTVEFAFVVVVYCACALWSLVNKNAFELAAGVIAFACIRAMGTSLYRRIRDSKGQNCTQTANQIAERQEMIFLQEEVDGGVPKRTRRRQI
jgi:hypothetical protein